MKRYLLSLLSTALVVSAGANVYESANPAEGIVTKPSIRQINLTFPNCSSNTPNASVYAKVIDAKGDSITKYTPSQNSYGDAQLIQSTALTVSGDYYMIVPAGAWLLDAGTDNQRVTEEFSLHYCLLSGRDPLKYTSTSIPAGFCDNFSEVIITFNYTDSLDIADAASIGLYANGSLSAAADEVTATGNQLKIKFNNAPNGTFDLTVPANSVTYHGIPCFEVAYNYEISNAPYGITPADGSEIGTLSQIAIEFKQYTKVARNIGNGVFPAIVTNATGNEVAHSVVEVGSGNVATLYLSNIINTPGTYNVKVPEGLIALNYNWDTYSSESVSPEFNFTYTVTGATLTPVQTTPAQGEVVGSMFGADFVIETTKEVTLNENAGYAYVTGPNIDGEYIYTISLDEEQTNHGHFKFYHTLINPGTYSVVFPAGYFKIGNELSTALEFDYTLVEGGPVLPTEISPADSTTVSYIQDIDITFGQATELTYVQEYGNTVYVIDSATGERVHGAYADFYTYGLATFTGNQVKLHFKEAVSAPGEYDIHICKGTFKVDNDVNTDFSLHYTVADLGDDLVEFTPSIAVENLLTIGCTFVNEEKIRLNNNVAEEVEAVLYKVGTNDSVTIVKKAVVKGNAVTFTLKKTVAEEGNYKLIIPQHFFYVGTDAHLSKKLTATFTVKAPDEPTAGSYETFSGEVTPSLPYASGRYSTTEGFTGYGNYSIAFFNVPLDNQGFIDGTGELLNVEFLTPYSEHMDLDKLVGTYTPAKYKNGIYEAGNFVPGMWSTSMGFYAAAGTTLTHYDAEGYTDKYGLVSAGSITVSKLENGNYKVVFDLTTRENAHITATYTGKLQNLISDFTNPSDIDAVEQESDEEISIYDLQGRLISTGSSMNLPEHGTFVVRRGNKQHIIML